MNLKNFKVNTYRYCKFGYTNTSIYRISENRFRLINAGFIVSVDKTTLLGLMNYEISFVSLQWQ